MSSDMQAGDDSQASAPPVNDGANSPESAGHGPSGAAGDGSPDPRVMAVGTQNPSLSPQRPANRPAEPAEQDEWGCCVTGCAGTEFLTMCFQCRHPVCSAHRSVGRFGRLRWWKCPCCADSDADRAVGAVEVGETAEAATRE